MFSVLRKHRTFLTALLLLFTVGYLITGCDKKGSDSQNNSNQNNSKEELSGMGVVLDSEEAKYYKVKLPTSWSGDGYKIILKSYSTHMAVDSAAFLESVIADPTEYEWKELAVEKVWPKRPLTVSEKEIQFCKILIRVINPNVRLVKNGYTRLYTENVNVVMKVVLSDRDEREGTWSRIYVRYDANFSLKGDGFFCFISGSTPSDTSKPQWVGGSISLGTLYTMGKDVLYRQELHLSSVN